MGIFVYEWNDEEKEGKRKDMMTSLSGNMVCKGWLDSLETSALAGAFGVRVKVTLHTDAILFANIDPALGEEGMRVWEHSRVGLMKYGCHADDGLCVC